eukprot:TRINITY_DN201_c0_g2_i1.p1 TRINITY_DN201_c0_g2~~TRINITY_DN201_c0_g2_i1.p1  ORF type:complete len:523 (-),score=128.50 TRINITY_DN201_c0_g2_i1:391-1959(-)
MSFISYEDAPFTVESDNVKITENEIVSTYKYDSNVVKHSEDGKMRVVPTTTEYSIKTETTVPKVGMMLIGLGGNNGTTVYGGVLANKKNITYREPRKGLQEANYYGSLTQASTIKIGVDEAGKEIFVPINKLVPMVHPNDIVIHGWDISSLNLAQGMERAGVFPVDLQRQLSEDMAKVKPLPSIYYPQFIAANQADRADNVKAGNDKWEHVEAIREDIRNFKAANGLDKVILLWTANTERYSEIREGLNDTTENLMASIKRSEDEISPSTIFAVASILEGCSYVNGSPQNTFVPGVVELAKDKDVFIGGDDFKSGQTKMKSVLTDFLVNAGIKPVSIVSYNHLGNNDGKNLSAPSQFRSKEISKSGVVDDMVACNGLLYKEDEHPDHCVVIKYVPFVGDSKRALDEYTSEIFMGGHNTISMHNTCEDSLLAAPIILDLVILTEMFERITIKGPKMEEFERFHAVLSFLSFLTKAPLVPEHTPVVNALPRQRDAICNFLRACIGLPAENNISLEYRLKSAGSL